MKIKNLITDDDAVSPVIGVILMVAITVILAAVIGAFVLNIGGSQEKTPQASITFENRTTSIYAVHEGGGELNTGNLDVVGVENATKNGFPSSETWSAGQEYEVADSSGTPGVTAGPTSLDIVWESPNSDKTSVIASYNE